MLRSKASLSESRSATPVGESVKGFEELLGGVEGVAAANSSALANSLANFSSDLRFSSSNVRNAFLCSSLNFRISSADLLFKSELLVF